MDFSRKQMKKRAIVVSIVFSILVPAANNIVLNGMFLTSSGSSGAIDILISFVNAACTFIGFAAMICVIRFDSAKGAIPLILLCVLFDAILCGSTPLLMAIGFGSNYYAYMATYFAINFAINLTVTMICVVATVLAKRHASKRGTEIGAMDFGKFLDFRHPLVKNFVAVDIIYSAAMLISPVRTAITDLVRYGLPKNFDEFASDAFPILKVAIYFVVGCCLMPASSCVIIPDSSADTSEDTSAN